MYDLKNDPDQMHNVAGQKKYARVPERLSSYMDSLLRTTGDPRISDFDKMPYTITNERLNKRQKQVEEYFKKMMKESE